MAKIAGRKRLPIGILTMAAIIYIGFGDAFLPGVLGRYSYQARATLDQFLLQIFPSWKLKTNPYERTERAIEKEEGKK
jgi:hypothetical protein